MLISAFALLIASFSESVRRDKNWVWERQLRDDLHYNYETTGRRTSLILRYQEMGSRNDCIMQ